MSDPYTSDKLPLKTFWEAVERRLAECSADDLRAILRAMAREVRPSERSSFLTRLGVGAVSVPTPRTPWENLLADIDDLAQEIHDAMENADEWEEAHGWEYEYEEDSLGPYEEFVEPLTALFERTGLAFDSGEIALARQAYEKLLDLIHLEDDYGRGVNPSDLPQEEMQEAAARYLRAVYESEPPARRPAALYEPMRSARSRFGLRWRSMLEDILQISPRPLPDQEAFLNAWIAFLRAQSDSDADAWLREAIRLSEGTAGLERLALTEGQKHPRAYLDWFAALEQEGKHAAVLAAARQALDALPANLPIRAAIADHLCAAAAALHDPPTLLLGRWEAFAAKPTLARLLGLWEAAPAGEERMTWMHRAIGHIEATMARIGDGNAVAYPAIAYPVAYPWELDDLERPAHPGPVLLLHARLLAGDLEVAYRSVTDRPVLGWSSASSDQAVAVSFFLVLLSGRSADALPPNLAGLWSQTLGTGIGYEGYDAEGTLIRRLEQVYAEHLAQGVRSGVLALSPEQQQERLAWCLDVARRRVEAIVGNQHRKSYGKAAALAVACAEVLRARGEPSAARAFVAEIGGRFPRHRAFQDELKRAVQGMERAFR
jgi:tetratricopeptide (TPR) repeat protein